MYPTESISDYVLLKEFDLQSVKADKVLFHSLYIDKDDKKVKLASTENYLDIHPNAIADTFSNLYDREVERSMGGNGK